MQVSLALLVSSSVLLLLQGCCTAVRGWKVLKNDATEILPEYRENSRTPHEAILTASNNNSNTMNNRAKNGGRTANTVSYSASELSCRELRSTRYITDGSCRSAKPVKELVCSGQCMPSHLMPNSIGRGKWWRGSATDYRCIPAHSRTRRVQLQCPNGNTRTYKIRVVTSCKCKRFRPHHNQSEAKEVPKTRNNKKHSRLPQDRNKNNTPALLGNSY
ncbi:sclerostin [Plectropomus leopardus]|uniref:sclerostin n=1 Tax=Plectropomus leopardus TaxID=160734 RepID=UPI001C4B318B|nr:sclerostin [Plectropomus leopardus]